MINNKITSLIRTYVPIVIGAMISWLTLKGLEFKPEQIAGLTEALIMTLTVLSQMLYYAIARLIETKWPEIGKYLLGSSKQPVYKKQ